MALLIVIVAILAFLAAIWAAARNATTVCVLEVTKGKVTVTRGALAPRVLSDIGDVVSRPKKVAHATIRISRARGRAEVELRGTLSKDQQQQLRNVIGTVPLAKLENGKRRAKKR